MPNRNFSISQKRLPSNLMMGGRFADRRLSLKDSIKKKHGTRVMSVSIIPLVILSSNYGHPAFIVLYIFVGLLILLYGFIGCLFLKKKGWWPFSKKVIETKEEVKKEETPLLDEEKEEISPVVTDEEKDEEKVVKDEKGNIFRIRFVKSFEAKLIQSSDEVKAQYSELKNYALSYKKATSRTSWYFDSINYGREKALKFTIRGKTLCLFLNLDHSSLEPKYKVEEAKGKRFAEVPCLYRIKNDRRLSYAKKLIDMVMENLGVTKGKEVNDDYCIAHETTESLLSKGLIKETKTKIEAD